MLRLIISFTRFVQLSLNNGVHSSYPVEKSRLMTAIYFYSGVADKLQVVCRLCAKAFRQKVHVIVYSSDPDVLEKLDKLLWSFQATSFLPHCFIDDEKKLVNSTLINLSNQVTQEERSKMLINLNEHCPPFFDHFERVIEIVGLSSRDKSKARERYRFYKKNGYELHHHDLSK